ncbi:Fc.00g021080.m01.CDS01 [Cosmosporella sp. VM-42]
MAPSADATVPATRRTRKSIGAHTDIRKAMEKENATVDVASTLAASRKKSRSKSLGPGGLDALKKGNGNRRASLAAPSKPPRSILKPTIPPLAEIPPLKKKKEETDLIDLGEPTRGTTTISQPSEEASGSKIAVRTEEEQQAAARERDARDRRDARRKSLANRRVSFAAEATLHTFHEVEYMQDSTTSTDSTRRNSSISGQSPGFTTRESTPQDQVQSAPESPNNQRDLHQRKQRRSSGLPPLNFNNPEDDTIASTVYSSDSEPADAVEEVAEVEDGGSSSDSDDGTMMSIDTEEVTGTTIASDRSIDSNEDSSTLDEALRLAARRAGTQRLGEDQSDDGLDDGEELIPSFGWANPANKQNVAAHDQENRLPHTQTAPSNQEEDEGTEMEMDMDTDMDMDMDMTRAVGGIIRSSNTQELELEEEMSMDVTRAFGGIIPQKALQKETSAAEDDDEDAPMEQVTMEFTTAIGGIRRPVIDEDESEDDEDMSMELTTVMGGVLSQQKRKSIAPSRRRTMNRTQRIGGDDATMDMTVGLGRIISGPSDNNNTDEEDGDATMGMDMTTAIGGILSNATTGSRALGKRIMEEEVDAPDDTNKAILAAVNHTVPHEPTSPGLSAFHGKALRRSVGPQTAATLQFHPKSRTPSPEKSTTPKSTPKPATPKQVEPSTTPKSAPKAKTPTSVKPSTPQLKSKSPTKATPQSSARKLRSASSLAKAETRTPSPAKSAQRKSSVFHDNPRTGSRTPTVVLTPQKRRLSGIGADRTGLGSPRIAALFDRRSSIGDVATDFVPGKRAVTFQDPKVMAEEIDRERKDEEDKENQRKILEREADGSQDDKDATLNLREMIKSMSPKRRPLKGRKSLHVGSAKGLLGKRPNELDEEEEAEENDGIKRLKGHQSSPVKNVRLQQPPSKEETTGRLTRPLRKSLQPNVNSATPTLSSPGKNSPATTPKNQGRFKDVHDDTITHTVNFNESPVKDAGQLEQEIDEDEERIHLQDFLNMTSIRFMELTTTKRRHTQAPGTLRDGLLAEGQDEMSLERCVVAGACTVPMLELYQHSCRELKKYISEGRRMVKEIETDTFEENPHLFREYMSATPEVKALMDNQFKNVKTHARLLSKAMWYEWRMKLQDGLKEGLVRIAEGMEDDEENLKKQQDLLSSILPAVVARYESLLEESGNLEQVAQELAGCDPSELETARDELMTLDDDIRQKKRLIADLQQQFQASETDVESLTTRKQQCLEDIKESEKIREECRGWTSTEVNALKARVDAIEKEHGWAVTGISGKNLSMAYRREIELVLDTAAFRSHQPNSRIDLWYIADAREHYAVPKTPEKEFFLQCIRDHIRALPQSRTKISHLLHMVRLSWDKANLVSSQISRLNVTFPTKVMKTSDASLAMTSSLLLVPLETRVETTLHLHGESGPDGLEVTLAPEAKVIYGEHFNVAKVGEFLAARIGKRVDAGEEEWSDVMVELHERLIARGKK